MIRFRSVALVCASLIAVAALGACGKDLSKLKDQAIGLATKYKPQVESGLKTVTGLLDQAKTLPADLPVVGGLVQKLAGQKDNLVKLQGVLEGLPGQAEAAAKAGKEDDLKKLITTVDTEVGAGVKAAETVAAEGKNELQAAKAQATEATVKAAVAKLGELAPPLTAAIAKVDEKLAAWKAMPQDTLGLADVIKAAEDLEREGDATKVALDAAVVSDVPKAFDKDAAAGTALVEELTTRVTTATKKLETDIAALETKVAASSGPAPATPFAKALATGFEVKGNAQGVEAQLIAFVEDPARPVDKTTWFDFDRLTFASGSTNLDMEASKDQLANIVEILKAFPAAKLKLGGYTDNDGAADVNKKISQQRAESVVKALVDLGVAADRLEAEGYGPEFPVCPANDTPECKAQNRRIAVRVTAK